MEKNIKNINVLLLLDVNGILGERKYSSDTFEKYEGLSDFLDYCYQNYKVGFYSSMVKKNLMKILKEILTETQFRSTISILDRNFTSVDPEGKNPWDTLKDIKLIKDRFEGYRVLMCDDNASKMRLNNPNDYIIANNKLSGDEHFEYIKREIIKNI